MEKIRIDELEKVSGGSDVTIEFGDIKINVSDQNEGGLTEDDLKNSDAKRSKGAYAAYAQLRKNK